LNIFHGGMEMIENRVFLPVPGWYSDPYGEGQDRWWNGESWSEHVNEPFPSAEHIEPQPQPQPVAVGAAAFVSPSVPESPRRAHASHAAPSALVAGAFDAPAHQASALLTIAPEAPAAQGSIGSYQSSATQSTIGSYQMDGLAVPNYNDIALPDYGSVIESSYGQNPALEPAHSLVATALLERPANDDYWLSNAVQPRRVRANITNPSATSGFALGLLSVFLNPLYIVTIMGLRRSAMALRRATELEETGNKPTGRAKARWGIAFSLIGMIGATASIVAGVFLVMNIVTANAHFDKVAFEHTLSQSVLGQQGIALTAVDCPAAAPAAASSTFQCVASKPDGSKDVIYVSVLDDKGDISWKLGL
jgi:Protein of unknown function (DUF2510)/Domain of unknown function (DUF4333)